MTLQVASAKQIYVAVSRVFNAIKNVKKKCYFLRCLDCYDSSYKRQKASHIMSFLCKPVVSGNPKGFTQKL